MTITAATRLGPYEILSAIGAGGMGEVYRARDTRLKREVAIKILPESFAADPDRLARFQREAEVLASLNHPHIAQIYGVEESNSARALVMELVEGETLADRIARGAIPIDEALPIAKQIAEALEAAHEQGIIHRDLKPANIKVREDGTVKVLDFGLAKLTESTGPLSHGADATMSPTITSPALGGTLVGTLLGTAAYMAPEQAKGRPADKRSDIWAFGAVLYEMLTGRRAFDGDDVSDTLAAVLRGEPDWSALPASVPAPIWALLQHCLQKDRRKRVADVAAALFVLDEHASLSGPDAAPPSLVHRPLWRRITAMTVGGLIVATVTGIVMWYTTRPAEPVPPRVSRLSLALTGTSALTIGGIVNDLAITPDGSRVVYVGNRGTQLFVRALDALEPMAVFTGMLPRGPFVSADSQWIGFVEGANVLRKVAATGGPAVTLATIDGTFRGATWGPDDTIVFATGLVTTGLQRVGAGGGAVTVLTRPDRARGEADHLWPEMLPGGRAVLFTITPLSVGLDAAQVAVLDLQTGTRKILVRGGSHAHYVPSGHLVYVAVGTLRAVPFDLGRLETHGTPSPVISQVVTTGSGAVDAVVAGDGTLAYVSGGAAQSVARTLVWVDRRGQEQPLKVPARAYVYPRLSPDGTRVAAEVRDQEWDIWIASLANTTLTRFSFGPTADRLPVWTPDGRRIVWASERGGVSNLFWQAADGSGSVEQLTQSSNPQYSSAISPDGTRLVLREDTATRDLMVMGMDKTPPQTNAGSGRPPEARAQPLVQTPFVDTSAEISPDGRWVAYESDESGQDEIYVRPFPDVNAGRWQVSTEGGTKPLWARNGRELFYLVPSGEGAAVMSAPVERGASFIVGTPTKVLEGPYFFGTAGAGDSSFRTYDVSPDGQRFLMIKLPGGSEQPATSANLIVVQHWTEELKRLVPTK